MKIGMLMSSGTLSGAEKRSAKIANALNARGHDVTLFMDRATHGVLVGQDYSFEWPPVVVYDLPPWIRRLGFARAKLAGLRRVLGANRTEIAAKKHFWTRLLRSHDIELVHIFLDWERCREVTIPAVFEVTSPDIANRLKENAAGIPVRTHLHSVSEGVDARVRPHFPNNRCSVAPLPYFDPAGAPDPDPAAKENLIVFAHRMVARKNPVSFAKAAVRFLAERPDWRVAVRGTGQLEDEVRAILADDIAEGRVMFGYQADLMAELRRARIFVSLIEPDNYPSQAVMEAMWSGCALILSDRGRTRARFFANNGAMVEPEPDAVLDALRTLANDPVRTAEAGAASRRHLLKAFSPELYLEHLERVYGAVGQVG